MALSELEIKRVEKTMDGYLARHRPAPHIRSQLDIGWRLTGQSLVIFERRPAWDNPTEIRERSFVKTTFVRTTGLWKLFWMRQDLRWHGYEPAMHHRTLDAVIAEIESDPYSCFGG